MKKLFLYAVILAALVASLASPLAVQAGGRKHERSSFISCSLALKYPSALAGDTVVRLVRAESQAVTPDAASDELKGRVSGIYAVSCGDALSFYVHKRVNDYADWWFEALLDYLGLG